MTVQRPAIEMCKDLRLNPKQVSVKAMIEAKIYWNNDLRLHIIYDSIKTIA